MADRSSQLVLQALSKAAAESVAVPWFTGRGGPGLFPVTQAGKQAAQRCRDEGLLQDADNGTTPSCTLTDKGRELLLDQANPRGVLEDFVRVLEAREALMAQLTSEVRLLQTGMQAMRLQAAAVLERVSPPTVPLNHLFQSFHTEPPDLVASLFTSLARWSQSNPTDDCPLPELCRQVQAVHPDLSIGRFHDLLRRLHAEGRLYLHPWTGPLYALPEPCFVLLVGHELAYYASSKG